MSGGAFEYKQWHIQQIAEQVEHEIEINGRLKTHKEAWESESYNYKYNEEVIRCFKDAAKALRVAYIYAQRVDWLLSGDDGEDNFLKRLCEELYENSKLNK